MKNFLFIKNGIRILVLSLVFSCNSKTTTPDKFLNKKRIETKVYNDIIQYLQNSIIQYQDSVNQSNNSQTEILNVKIDTIFLNHDNKFVCLAIFERINPYIQILEIKGNEKGIDYKGRCYIGFIEFDKKKLKIINDLKYSVNSKESKANKKVKEKLRNIYLHEMEYIEGKYNINDVRFWNSDVWQPLVR